MNPTHSERGRRGRGEFGECWRAVHMEDEYKAKTTPVQIVRRHEDGSEELGHTIAETIAEEYTTLKAAVRRAVELHDDGILVAVDHMPDGRGGHTGGFQLVVSPSQLRAIVEASRAR